MKPVIIFMLAWMSWSGIASAQQGDDRPLGIATAEEAGTYYKMAEDIRNTAEKYGLAVKPIPTLGSLDALIKARHDPEIKLAILQVDTLYYVASSPTLTELGYPKDMPIVMPLHEDQVHILAMRPDIRTFEDLAGKRVAIGKPRSGSFITSHNLFNSSKIMPAERLEIGGQDALTALTKGTVDAIVYVIGQPAEIFSKLDERFHFVPITSESLKRLYRPGTILSSAYRNMGAADVPTLTVKNVMVAFAFKGIDCNKIVRLTRVLKANNACLRSDASGRWKAVDLNDYSRMPPEDEWERYKGNCTQPEPNTTITPVCSAQLPSPEPDRGSSVCSGLNCQQCKQRCQGKLSREDLTLCRIERDNLCLNSAR